MKRCPRLLTLFPAFLAVLLATSCLTRSPERRLYLLDPLPPGTPEFSLSTVVLLNSREMRYTSPERQLASAPHGLWADSLDNLVNIAIPKSLGKRRSFALHLKEVVDQGEKEHSLLFRAVLYKEADATSRPLEIAVPYASTLDAPALQKAYSEFLRQAAAAAQEMEKPPEPAP